MTDWKRIKFNGDPLTQTLGEAVGTFSRDKALWASVFAVVASEILHPGGASAAYVAAANLFDMVLARGLVDTVSSHFIFHGPTRENLINKKPDRKLRSNNDEWNEQSSQMRAVYGVLGAGVCAAALPVGFQGILTSAALLMRSFEGWNRWNNVFNDVWRVEGYHNPKQKRISVPTQG